MLPIRRIMSSGVEALIAPRSGAKVVAVQVYVWAGSLHEGDTEKGVAHFIEHILFKGTAKRKVGEIGSLVEAAGGDINAYTTFDRTVYHLTLPSSSLRLGVDILSDAVLCSLFDPEELEREREVILEEVRRGNDDPGAVIGKKIFSLMYPNTEAGRPIIGSVESVTNLSRDDLVGFYKRNYVKENISVVLVGDVDHAQGFALIEEFFPSSLLGSRPKLPSKAGTNEYSRFMGGGAAVIAGDYEQTRVEIAFPGPAMTDIDGLYLDLGAYILGGSEISRLQRALRDRDRVVSAIGCSAYSPSFRGVVEISASVDASVDGILKAIHGIGRELGVFLSSEPATALELERARAAFHINKIHREETVDGVARALGLSLMTPLKEKFEQTYEEILKKINTEDIMSGIDRWFALDQVAVVVLGSKSLKVDESTLKSTFLNGWNEGYKLAPKAAVEQKARLAATDKVVEFSLKNGTKVIYRHLPDAKMFSLMATTEGGLRFENTDKTGIFHAAAGMLGLATTTKSYEEFTGRLEDLGSVVGGFSGKDSCGWEVHSILENANETIRLWAECLMHPVIPVEQWASQKRETLDSLKMQQDSASYRCMRKLSESVYGDHPYSSPILGWPETIESFTADSLQKFYLNWRDLGPWVIAAAGGLSPKDIEKLLNDNLAEWKPKTGGKRSPTKALSKRKVEENSSSQMDKEQAHVALAWKGLTWQDSDRAALDVMINILGGHGGRLFVKLRDEQSLAYSVSPLASYGCEPGLVGAYLACKPDKVDVAITGMKLELNKISTELVTLEELERSKEHLIGSHEIGLQRTSSQSMTMGLMELYGLGWNDFQRYPETIRKVTINDVLAIAKKVFTGRDPVQIVVGPKGKQ